MVSVYGECWVNVSVIDCNNKTCFITLSIQISMCDDIQQL